MDILMKMLQENWTYVLLEAFGYIGTALVLISMMMTSVTKLRIVNIAGSLVSMTYAAICNTWPVVFLNFGLIVINVIQLVRLGKQRNMYKVIETDAHDSNVKYLIDHYLNDIRLYFPDFDPDQSVGDKTFIVYDGAEAIGILMGELKGNELFITLDYVSPKYRDRSVAGFLLNNLNIYGIERLSTMPSSVKEHNRYLVAMGFKSDGDKMVRLL